MPETFYFLPITNMVTVRNFEVRFGKFKVPAVCTRGNYAHK